MSSRDNDDQSVTDRRTDASVIDGSPSKQEHDRNEDNCNDDGDEEEVEEEEEEEEDVDFNPFVKGTASPELEQLSSSLSSEVVIQNDTQTEVQKPPVPNEKSKRRKSQAVPPNVDEEEDEDDAICKRTRARYSLVSFTLDELETFLQETDDEDDLCNVDDEEEYRKFLAAVLQGGDGDDDQSDNKENGNVNDDDDDVDFEIELEELLESDVDNDGNSFRRPETRQQNKRQNAAAKKKKKKKRVLEQAKRPLRPLLPSLPNVVMPETAAAAAVLRFRGSASSNVLEDGSLVNGFTLQQIGQLHCLIYEHVQLLVQVFSLCVLDSSKQQVASQVHKLINEMLSRRNEAIACRDVPYPEICFRPPNACPSVVDQFPGFELSRSTAGAMWAPFVHGPIVSVLDVAPLNLVGSYMADVDSVFRDCQRHHFSFETWNDRVPLFNLPCFPSSNGMNEEVPRGSTSLAANLVPSTVGQQMPKKTLAASIVENVKKQSVALVQKDISMLAQRFFRLFNTALFPHKPPPAAVVNRVLFTDSEDELLALGIMEYNTDWKAIQQRFLPCKSKHQIFVRQKNRCTSKAPENPIKAVRRMKTSPLAPEEIQCIQEGLKVFKLDWMSIWKFVVPHRDPSLLPRQWRIALGTQRSYKKDAVRNEKRRVYESHRRRFKAAGLANQQLVSEKEDNQADSAGGENNSGDDYVDNVNEAFVHQAFLADWRPGASTQIILEHPFLNPRENGIHSDTLSRKETYIREQPNEYGPQRAEPQIANMHGLPHASYYQYPHNPSHFTQVRHCPSNSVPPNHQVAGMPLNNPKPQIYMLPYRTRRSNGARLVKLAPELPPVNLPPSVRVIPQSAFKSNLGGMSMKTTATRGGSSKAGKEKIVPSVQQCTNLRTVNSEKTEGDKSKQAENTTYACQELMNSRPEESAVVQDTGDVEERATASDLQMHPLLFQVPEDGRMPYYPLTCSTGNSSSFSFFSGNQPQLNLSLFHNPHHGNLLVDCSNKSFTTKDSDSASCSIDFHPLLQRTDGGNSALVSRCTNTQQFVSLGGQCSQFRNPFNVVQNKLPGNPKLSCPTEKANELDLEIHLSSASTKGKTCGSTAVGQNNLPTLRVSGPNSDNTKEIRQTDSSCHQGSESYSTFKGNHVSGGSASTVPSNGVSRCNMDDIGDLSHPEIVMEQEELSDSDEEIEENVEFECEEMADSDGEGCLECEPIAQLQDKELPSCAKIKATTDVVGNQQCELRSPLHREDNISISRKSSPLLKLGLAGVGEDNVSSRSWLSLDTCAPIEPPPPSMKANDEHSATRVGLAAKDSTSCRPNRSCKKTTPSLNKIETRVDFMDTAQQLSLGPLAVSALRKPRKRASRTNTCLSMEMTTENSRCDQDKPG